MLNEEALLMLWHSDVKRHTGLEKLVVVGEKHSDDAHLPGQAWGSA